MKSSLSQNATAAIDHEKLKAMHELLGDDFKTLIQAFLNSATSIIESLPTAIINQDTKEAERLVHSLKSASANVGATTLSSLACEAENTIRNQDLNAFTTYTDHIKAEYEQVQAALKKELQIAATHKNCRP